MGSVPFSVMYFTTRRRSNMQLDAGDRTGSSGTSFDTEYVRIGRKVKRAVFDALTSTS